MASTGIGFRWLDILEKEFDTNFVDLDIYLGELESEDPDVVCNARQKMTALSSCFAQLTHKAQTIFQNSAKVEAELVNLRAELIEAKAKRDCLEQELQTVVLELHSAQLVNRLPGNHTLQKETATTSIPTTLELAEVNRIRKRLQEELEKSPNHRINIKNDDDGYRLNTSLLNTSQLKTESLQLYNENTALRNSILALHSEVYGARLAAKYLDKELAGRIQQLQLLGREMRGDIRDKLWRQLESEILLQRHKTVVRACRRNNGSITTVCQKPDSNDIVPTSAQGIGDTRLVTVKRKHGQGLGISITGGREHGVPILISELEPNGPAALSNQLYIGDAILSVNGIDLKQACHKEAVQVLQQQTGDCVLEVQYIASEDSDSNSLSEDGYNFQYRFFDPEVCDSNDGISLHPLQQNTGAMANTPTAPRTPESNEQSRGNSDLSCTPSPQKLQCSITTSNTGDIKFENVQIYEDIQNDNIKTFVQISHQESDIPNQTHIAEQMFVNNDIVTNENIKRDMNNCTAEVSTIDTEKVHSSCVNTVSQTETTNQENMKSLELMNLSSDQNSSPEDLNCFQENLSENQVIHENKSEKEIFISNTDEQNFPLNFYNINLYSCLDSDLSTKNCDFPDNTLSKDEKIDDQDIFCSDPCNEHEQFFNKNRTIIDIKEASNKNSDKKSSNLRIGVEFNSSSNSLLYTTESDNASSPVQTSTDNFLSSEVVSNNSDSPKNFPKSRETDDTSLVKTSFVVKNFKTELYEPKVYSDNLIELTQNLEESLYLSGNFVTRKCDNANELGNIFLESNFKDNGSEKNLIDINHDDNIKSLIVSNKQTIFENCNTFTQNDNFGNDILEVNFLNDKLAEISKIGDNLADLKLIKNDVIESNQIANLLELDKFQNFCERGLKHYSSNSESFSNATSPKSGQSFNASCPNESYESSPIHRSEKTCIDSRKNIRKVKIRKNHGVKTIQSIFRTNDYLSSDISSTNSDINDEISDKKFPKLDSETAIVHSPVFNNKMSKKTAKSLKNSQRFDYKKRNETFLPRLDLDSPTFDNAAESDTRIEKIDTNKSKYDEEAQKEFEQNIHAFLNETFSKNEVQLPNLRIINGFEKPRGKETDYSTLNGFRLQNYLRTGKNNRLKSDELVNVSSDAPENTTTVSKSENVQNETAPIQSSTEKPESSLLKSDSPSCDVDSAEGGFFNLLENAYSYSLQESDASDELDFSSEKFANLVQYGRNSINSNNDLEQFNASRSDTTVYIDEQKLKENKEKLLERYVRANHQKLLNLEGKGDPDFGTPV